MRASQLLEVLMVFRAVPRDLCVPYILAAVARLNLAFVVVGVRPDIAERQMIKQRDNANRI